MLSEPEELDEEEGEAPEEDIDSSEFFCRFTPMQIDLMASHLLGENPLCEKWISRDGKEAILYRLRLSYRKMPGVSGRQFGEHVDLREQWTKRFNTTTKKPTG